MFITFAVIGKSCP